MKIFNNQQQQRPSYEDYIEEIVYLKESGLGSRKIAKTLGLGKSTVNDWLKIYSQLNLIQQNYQDSSVDLSIKVEDNSRILIISDMHVPYHHKDSIKFLTYLKEKYNPTRIICMGDELDKHALSYHESDPDLPSAGDELKKALPVIAELKKLFPVMDILESNHGSLVYRKAKTAGIPRHYIKSYNDVLGVDCDWKWHYEMTIKLPDGKLCYFHHGKTSEVINLSQQMGMNAVQGHYHEKFSANYWGNPVGLYFGLQCGCLVDDKSLAMSYNNTNLKRPVVGTALIIDGKPILEPMLLNKNGRWIGA